MKKLFAAILIFQFASAAHAQTLSAIPPNVRASNVLQGISHITQTDMVYGIPMPAKRLIGDGYLDRKWNMASILLYKDEILVEGYPVRYDLLKDELEVDSQRGIKVLEGRRVKSFVWVDSLTQKPVYFINAMQYKNSAGEKSIGFFMVLADGKLPLFKKTAATIKQSNYSAQLNMGNPDDTVLKKEALYYAADGIVYTVPKTKKKLLPVFGNKQKQMEEFIKVNSLDVSTEDGLIKAFTHFNSIE
jgi:hypothetical protein